MDNSFDKWLSSVKVVWETGKPEDIAPLCADEITWTERPFEKPLTSKAEIVEEWNGILEQEDISFSYEVVSFVDGVGVARWNAEFKRKPTHEQVVLDGIFIVNLDENGKCTKFQQWYSIKQSRSPVKP